MLAETWEPVLCVNTLLPERGEVLGAKNALIKKHLIACAIAIDGQKLRLPRDYRGMHDQR